MSGNIVYSPNLQAPIGLTPASASIAVVGGSLPNASQNIITPGQYALLLASQSGRLALGMTSTGGALAVPGTLASAIMRLVTPANPAAGGLAVSGSAPSLSIGTSVIGDWSLRSTAAGVVKIASLSTAADLSAYAFAGSETVPPALDTTLVPFGQAGSAKFTISNADTTQSGTLKVPFGQAFAQNSTVWVSFRERMPPEFANLLCPTGDGSVQGFKQAILSGISSSNQAFEVVWESNQNCGGILGYNNSANGFNNWEQAYTPPGLPFDFNFQPSIGNDGAGSISPDSVYSTVNGGTDPDTGLAFSNSATNPRGGTLQQIEWARIGGSYNSQQDPAFAYGLGHPLAGEMRYPVNQWATYTYRIDVGTWGTVSTRLRAYVALEGVGYVKIADVMVRVDSGQDAGYNCIWLLPYYTNRIAGGVSVASRTNNITGVAIRVVGLGTATGAGTLSWNATTKKLTWQQSGGTTGTVRGVASWKRWVNVFTGSGATGYSGGQYLGLEVTNFAALPATNQTDTVTIQSGRLATQTNKAEIIISSNPINATAYNSAGVKIGPTGGFPPSDGSALANFVANMTSGTWAHFSTGDLSHTLTNPLSDDPTVSNGSRGDWDNSHGKFVYIGGGHGTQYQQLTSTYTDATATWDNTDTPPVVSGVNTGSHQFNNQSMNPATGDMFYHMRVGSTCYYRPYSGSWSQLDDGLGSHGQLNGNAFNPFANSGNGAHVFGSLYGIAQYNPNLSSFSTWWAGFSGFNVGDHALGFFDYGSQSVYICGGSSFSGLASVQVSKTGTVTQKGNLPTAVDVPTSTNNPAVVVDGYKTPGGIIRKAMIVKPGGSMWEYDNATGNDTWNVIAGVTAPATPNANNGVFIGCCSVYDCIILMQQSDSLGGCQFEVYKR